MKKTLVSACLLGTACRYDGKACRSATSDSLEAGGVVLLPFCPEVAGGLGIPREPAEICGGDGYDVLAGRARVVNRAGVDVTANYVAGARAACRLCQKEGIETAILRARSPSCGTTAIYDGYFRQKLRSGPGVTAALLQQNGVAVQER